MANPLSRKEWSLLLNVFNEYYSKQYPFALLLALTGIRIGEALVLLWGDEDFNSRLITVQRSITNEGKVETTKNNKYYCVDIPNQLIQTLTDLRHQR